MESELENCPKCGADKADFVHTETCEDKGIRDYHFLCEACGHTWYEIWHFIEIGIEAEDD